MSLLARALRNDSPVPLVRRTQSYGFPGLTTSAVTGTPLDQMSNVGTLFAVVDRIAQAVACVEWDLYQRPADGKIAGEDERKVVSKHAALDLWRQPNPFMTTAEFVHLLTQHRKLVGEWVVVVTKTGQIPVELWPVRPDRMTPVTHPTKFLTGWLYQSPDGERVPLMPDQVIQCRMPHPSDPYRGLGPVQTILTELQAAQYTAEWNRNFFQNSAEPGGVIELPTNLSDAKWEEFVTRWRSQHQGVKNAHRVAVIEHGGKYVPRGYSQREMEFSALREASRDTILEAFGISRATLGITDGVNFAAAKAADAQFTKLLTIPELRAIQQTLNTRLLPMFYPGKRASDVPVEFDYDCKPSEDDKESALAMTAKVGAVTSLWQLSGVKFDLDELLKAYDLPVVPWEEAAVPLLGQMFGPDGEVLPQPPPPDPNAPNVPPGGDGAGSGTKPGAPPGGAPARPKPAPDQPPPGKGKPPPARSVANADDPPPEWDPTEHDRTWREALARLLARFAEILAGWRRGLGEQIAHAVDSGDLAQLADLSVDSDSAAEALHAELTQIAHQAALSASAEAAAQGAHAPPTVPPADELNATAVTVTALLAQGLAVAAGREALRQNQDGRNGQEVAREVVTYLAQQSDAPTRTALGSALHGTQNRARVDTWAKGPVGSLYASEVLDSNTCGPCRRIDGRFICTTEDLRPYDRLYTAIGGYVDCEGGPRCRGTVTGVWRPKTTTSHPEEA